METKEYRRLVSIAHATISNAYKSGRITKSLCEVCGAEAVEGHHTDYRLPYLVRWLCRLHHKREHKGKSHKYQFLGADSWEPQPVNWGNGCRYRVGTHNQSLSS